MAPGANKLGSVDPKTMMIHEDLLPNAARPRRIGDGKLYHACSEVNKVAVVDLKQ